MLPLADVDEAMPEEPSSEAILDEKTKDVAEFENNAVSNDGCVYIKMCVAINLHKVGKRFK